MKMNQFAPVIDKESICGLRPEPDAQLCLKGFISLVSINELDRATEKIFRVTIS